MALLYADSFEHEDRSRYSSSNPEFVSGRNGMGAHVGDDSSRTIFVNVSPSDSTFVVGFAVWIPNGRLTVSGDIGSDDSLLLEVENGSSEVGSVWVSGAGWSARIGGSAAGEICSQQGSASEESWYYVELKGTLDASSGSGELRVNGESMGSISSTDTSNNGTTWTRCQFGGGSAVDIRQEYIDDLVIMDGSGSACNDFLGDVWVQYLVPDGDSTPIQLTGSDADQTDNYDNVNETIPDSTDYNGSTGTGQKDYYTLTDLSTANSWNVYGAMLVGYVGKGSGVNRYGRVLAQQGGSTDTSTTVGLSTSYGYVTYAMSATPSGTSWNVSKINDLEVGFETRAST